MFSRSGRGRWQHVLDARKQVREGLDRANLRLDPYDAPIPNRTVAAVRPLERMPYTPRVIVLSLGKAASRLA